MAYNNIIASYTYIISQCDKNKSLSNLLIIEIIRKMTCVYATCDKIEKKNGSKSQQQKHMNVNNEINNEKQQKCIGIKVKMN